MIWHKFSNRVSCSSWFLPNTIISSDIYLGLHLILLVHYLMCFGITPRLKKHQKLSRLYLSKPTCVVKFVMFQDSSFNSNWWYPLRRFIFENTLDPFKSKIISWSVGVIGRRRKIALFGSLISTHNRILWIH